ncbi:MAG TPA: zinc-binding dehydrogenase [Acidimicrobiales bacterium]|nr:zinc-binding dehydrogenase [Acidimicrobiales bacterium]
MKAAVYYENGAPSVFRYEDVVDPVPGDDEILIQVHAVSIEGGDTLNRLRGELRTTPHIVGYQAAGTVLAVGSRVADFEVGERVVTLNSDGSHAELRAAYPNFTWKIPEGLSTEVASAVPTAFGTAHDSLFEFGRLAQGETALIHAGASGVGIAAIQMAKRAGATVLATASSNERLARLVEFGLDAGINYVEDDFVARVRELTDGRGANVIVDSVGGENLQKSLRALAYRGRCVSMGDAGRKSADALDITPMRQSNQSFTRYFLGAELFFGTRAYAQIASILDDVASGELRVVIDRTYPLSQAAEAHAYIEARESFGRVLLVP